MKFKHVNRKSWNNINFVHPRMQLQPCFSSARRIATNMHACMHMLDQSDAQNARAVHPTRRENCCRTYICIVTAYSKYFANPRLLYRPRYRNIQCDATLTLCNVPPNCNREKAKGFLPSVLRTPLINQLGGDCIPWSMFLSVRSSSEPVSLIFRWIFPNKSRGNLTNATI